MVPVRNNRKTLRRFDRSRRRSIFVRRRGRRRHLGTVGLVVGFAVAGVALVDIAANIASEGASPDHGAEHEDPVEDHTDPSP